MRYFWIVAALAMVVGLTLGCQQDEEEGTQFVVIKCIPSDQQTNVSQQAEIFIRFTHVVDHKTVMGTKQIILADQMNSLVPITYSFHGEIVKIQTGSPLAANATYGVAVRPGVRDVYGNNVDLPFAATFATGPNLTTIPNWPPFTIPPTGTVQPLGPPGTFTPVSSLFVPRARHTASRLHDGRVIVIGGESSVGFGWVERSAEIFDPATLMWTMSASNNGLGMYFERAGHTAEILQNGRILVVGGTLDGVQALNTAEIYDPIQDQFYPVASPMIGPRMFHASSRLDNGNVLVSGGATTAATNTGWMTTPLTDTMEVYDVKTGTFQMTTVNLTQIYMWNPVFAQIAMIGVIYHTSTSLPDTTVLLAGGLTFLNAPAIIGMGVLYAPDINGVGINGTLQLTGTANMKLSRFEHRATLIPEGHAAGLVVITGGCSNAAPGVGAEVYDYAMVDQNTARVGVFQYLASNMTAARRSHTSTYIAGGAYAGRTDDWGKILVTGGSQRMGTTLQSPPYPPHVWPFIETVGCGGCSATDTADIFDPFSFSKTPHLPFAGINQTGQFIPTQDATGNQTFLPMANFMGVYWHTATGLLNGSVLIAGGYDCVFCIPGPAEGQTLSGCAIYNP
ncbi:MAG: Ig-like domain-containing protein [Planctomycetota bacterium]|jgi:hypothetical protein